MADGTKPWYTSKAVWTGIVAAVIALYNTLSPSLGWPSIPEYVFGILAALGIYTRVVANTTLTK